MEHMKSYVPGSASLGRTGTVDGRDDDRREDATTHHIANFQTMHLARPDPSFGKRRPQRRASGGPMTAILRDRPNWQHRESSGVTSFMEDFHSTAKVIPGGCTRRASIRVTESFRDANAEATDPDGPTLDEEGSDSGDSTDFLSADDVRSCVVEDPYIRTIRSSTAAPAASLAFSPELRETYFQKTLSMMGKTQAGGGVGMMTNKRVMARTTSPAKDNTTESLVDVVEVPLSQYGMLPVGEYKAHFLQVKQVLVLSMPPSQVRFASLDRSCIRVWKACGVTESVYEFPAASPGFICAIEARKDKQLLLAATLNGCLKVMTYSLHDTATLRTHRRPFLRMLYDEDSGRLLTTGMDGMHLWAFVVAIEQGLDRTVTYELSLLRTFADTGRLFSREIIPLNGFHQVACQSENVVEIFNVSDGSRASTLLYDEVARLTALAYLPSMDGLAAGDFFGTLSLWTRAAPPPSPPQDNNRAETAPVSPRLPTCDSVTSAVPSTAAECPPSSSSSSPASPASASSSSYLKVHSLRVHHCSILSICRHPRPECLLTAGSDGLIKTISMESYEVLHVITASKDPLPLLKHVLHPDLSLCVCGTSRGQIRLWALSATGQRFASFIKPVQRVQYYAPPRPPKQHWRVRGRGATVVEEQGQQTGHVVVWTEARDVQRFTADGRQAGTLPRRLALLEVCQYDYSPTSEVLFCLCKNGDVIAVSMKTDPPSQVGAWPQPEKTHEGRISCLRFFHLHPPPPPSSGFSSGSMTGRWETLMPTSTTRPGPRLLADTGAPPEETLIVGTAGGYLGLRDALGNGQLYRTAATGIDVFLDMKVADELSVVHVLAERGGEVVGLSWSLPSFTPGYCIQTAARPTLMEVSRCDPLLMYGFADGHVLLFDTTQHDTPRLIERRRDSQGEHLCAVTAVAMHDGLKVLATVDRSGLLHFWDYNQHLVAAVRLEFAATSISFLTTTGEQGGAHDLLVAKGREVLVVPSRAWYPPHRRFQIGDYLIQKTIAQGLQRARKSHAWAGALNNQRRHTWSLASNGQQLVRVRAKEGGEGDDDEEEAAAAAAQALLRSEDPHNALAGQVRAMQAAVVVNDDKVGQLISRLRPLVLEGGVDEADYDLLEGRNHLSNNTNQAEDVLEVRLAKAFIGNHYKNNNAQRRRRPAARALRESMHKKEALPRKPEPPPAPSALSDKERRQRRGIMRLQSAVRALRATTGRS